MYPSAIGILLAVLNSAAPAPSAVFAAAVGQTGHEVTAAEALLEVDPDRMVWITTRQTRTIAGTLVSQSDSSLDLRTPAGIVTVPHAAIIRVEVKQGRNTWRGALTGAVIGGVTLPILVAMEDCTPGTMICLGGPGLIALAGLWGAGIGAGAGAIAGSFSSHRVRIYPRSARTVSLAPAWGRGRSGVYAAVAW